MPDSVEKLRERLAEAIWRFDNAPGTTWEGVIGSRRECGLSWWLERTYNTQGEG